MKELGTHWAHYSMRLLQQRPRANTIMMQPGDDERLAGELNFERHGDQPTFLETTTCGTGLAVNRLFDEQGVGQFFILQADGQGAWVEMLMGAEATLRTGCINPFRSTHSQNLHLTCHRILADFGL